MRLDGKVALISGGAHGVRGELMGFGGASAWMFTREGAKVVLGDIDVETGEKTASQIREDGGDAVFVRLDVTSESDWDAAVRTTVDSFGTLDVLVNNAGTSDGSIVEDTTEEKWDGQMDVHAKGAFLGPGPRSPRCAGPGAGRSSTYRPSMASWGARGPRPITPPRERCGYSPSPPRYSMPRTGYG